MVSRLMLPVFLLAACCFSARAEDDVLPGLENTPAIVAEVNGRAITRNELLRELAGANGTDAISRLVQRILIEQGAKQKNVSVSAQDIEQQFAADKRALSSDLLSTPWEKTAPEEIIKAHYGMTIDEYKQLVIRQRLLTRRSVGEGTNPSDDQLLGFFAKENSLFQPPVMYHAQHILISPFDPRDLNRSLSMMRPEARNDFSRVDRRNRINRARDQNLDFRDEIADLDPVWQRAGQMAQKVLREITTGQITFDNAVRKYTQDPADQMIENKLVDNLKRSERERAGQAPGDVGWFSQRGPMVDQFFAGVKDMKPGEVKGPIRTPYGYHIVKMLEVRAPPPVTYESCKEAVYRAYMDRQISEKADKWIEELEEGAVIRIDRAKLWPPVKRAAVVLPDAGARAPKPEERDPVVASVNNIEIRRSELWRELLRADGEDALKRLINMEIVMTMLKVMGLERLDWECADPSKRQPQPPTLNPIKIPLEAIDLDLNDDRLRHDVEAPASDFRDYIFAKYGQSIDEYKRKLEATLVLMEAIRRKIRVDDATLRVQFALAKENYTEPEWYQISHILIVPTGGMQNPDKNAHLQAKLIADHAYQSYQASPTAQNFTQLVKDLSMDDRSQIKQREGKLGACYPDMRNPDLPEAPQIYREIRKQKLEKGMISTPIRTFRGYHVVRIDSKHPAMQAIYENTKKKIERDYLNERAKFYTDIWLRSLNTRAQVKKFMYNRVDDLKVNSGPQDYFPIPKE